MSQATISYSALSDAAEEATNVATRMDDYSAQVNEKIYRKLLNYKGTQVDGLSAAKSNAIAKRDALSQRATNYRTYATDLRQLSSTCDSVDKQVQQNIAQMSSSFCKQHHISITPMDRVGIAISNTLNDTVVGRFIDDGLDFLRETGSELKDHIKHWYNFGGGEQWVDALFTGALSVAICAITIFLLPAGGFLGLVGFVSALILVANTGCSFLCDGAAAFFTATGDPVRAYHVKAVDTIQDSLRLSDSRVAHGFAKFIDITDAVCSVIIIGSALGKTLSGAFKNCHNWASKLPPVTDGPTPHGLGRLIDSIPETIHSIPRALSSIPGRVKSFPSQIKTIFNQSKVIFTQVKTNTGASFTDLKTAIQYKDFSSIRSSATTFSKEFGRNLWGSIKNDYFNYSEKEAALKSARTTLYLAKDTYEKGGEGFVLGVAGSIPLLTFRNGQNGTSSFVNVYDTYQRPASGVEKFFKAFKSKDAIDMDALSDIADFTYHSSNITIPLPEIPMPQPSLS